MNCNFCTSAQIGLVQSTNAYVGSFTVQSGPPIIVYPAYQNSSPMVLYNNTGATGNITWGCQGGNVSGSCLFSIRTIPSADPVF